MSEIERFAKDAEDMREAYQSTVEHKGENALCIEKFYLRLWTAAAEALREQAERSKGCVFCGEERHRIREAFDEGTAKIISADNRYALSVDTSRDAAIFNIFFCPMCGKRLEVEP